MDYLTIKWLHVLSSTVLFGTGIGSAFYLLLAHLGGEVDMAAWMSRRVVLADWLFTASTAVLQPLTGVWLLRQARLPASTPWVAQSIALYAVAIACWLPVVWIQLRLRALAARAQAEGALSLPVAWGRWVAAWTVLGAIAFVAFLLIFHLMVVKRLPFA
ncbi:MULTISPECIES: DUF2269 domain-containing protein [Ramlibacter]|uniref:DUF2269 domain-containing protein n=1 Tax=Ramlibacter aquaticus TaxID=2780094 RepID=A0ABR9SJI4_9BURK|nr:MULTISPECIES: DUF2269 domain-containing protein [Ramlibacter]MBE7941927.1 DUF2269 domain-containing protein [Ramlibacter aquaticus]